MDRLASMETFIRVVETGSFSGAARQLRVGQPAVSKTVAQLENYLGVKLLTRSTRGLTPTEAGLGYFERAKRAIEEADEAELAARAINVSPFVSCQDEYSLVVREIEKDLLPAVQEYKLGLLPFFPLASGLLTGKYKRGTAAPEDTRFGKSPALRDRYVTPRNEDMVGKLQAFAEKRGHSMLELTFSWLASRPQVASVIAGATRAEQVEQNVKAIGWALSAEELAEIDGITK